MSKPNWALGVVTAGHVSTVCQMAGVRLPIESVCLQALVSEPIKPVIDTVLPLDKAVEGLRLIETREVFGKVVVTP